MDPLDWLLQRQEAMQALLAELVNTDSPSTDKEAVDRLGARLARELADAGAEVQVYPQTTAGDHLLARWPGTGAGGGRLFPTDKPALLLCHMDTVWDVGEAARRPFRVEGDKAFGPGVFDMKAGIVQAVFALRCLAAAGGSPRAVQLLVTSDEETGSETSRPLIEELARQSACVLVLEPAIGPDGKLKTWRKGVGGYRLVAYGREAHAGADPEKGVSAVEELAHQILRIRALADPARGTTLNVGVVRGGSRPNVVPGRAEAEIDLRVTTLAEARRVDAALRGLVPVLPGARLELEGGLNRPPMERGEAGMAMFALARQLAEQLGFPLGETGTGGGSDGNFTAALGVPTLDGLGAVGDGAHSPEEHIVVAELPRRAALLVRLLQEL